MGAVGVLSDGDPPLRVETLHESGRTRVTRLFLPGRTVIRKQPLGPDAVERLEHERAMLERLRGLDGVAQVVDAPRYPDSIVLADVGGTSTAARVKPLAVDDLIRIAVALARALAGMHRRGVMHRDITPANVVLSGDGVPCLVDFALAASAAETRPAFTHHSEMVGTLAYLAPEQTGRTGRPVDQRADLYAAGATLYEFATGGPPFGTGDPLRLIHDHLARVPVPPERLNPAIPRPLSEIILHLLEKEPDHRYQTADGVVYDLERLRNGHPRAGAASFRIGERDVPPRLVPPSQLVGREDEVAVLGVAFEQALMGRSRGLLVSGAPGVGKTALCNELRPVVTGGDGWFVAGKFDQYRRDLEFDGVYQAFRALGRLLLAEPDDELVGLRERILRALGPNAGLTAAVVPEFAALLAVPPDPGDPLTAQVRAQRNAREILRAVASRKRPLVFFVDDLQWAGRTPLGLFDLALAEEPIEGLLLVGAYREDDVNAAHPLAALLSRWREAAGARQMRLANLSVSGFVAMVAEMLHVDQAPAAELTEVIAPHTGGNPYDTAELLNALRRDGLLATTAAGSQWDVAVLRAHLGAADVAGLMAGRVEALPAESRAAVEAMACLGGWAELGLLQAATGEPANRVERALAPALEDGLLVAEPGAHPAVRFRHDRLREATLCGLDPPRRGALQLAMARRLVAVPELFAAAAQQYLPVAGAVDDAAERRSVVGLLRRTADQAALIGDYAQMDALLATALGLISPDETATLIAVHTSRHAALYGLGRLEEADDAYLMITGLCAIVAERASATAIQVRSLTYRSCFAEAIALSVESLRELGITVPAAERRSAELDRQFGHLYRWLDHIDTADELARPEITDPALLAAADLINAALPACYVSDPPALAWLSLEALRIWIEHGPAPSLPGPISHCPFVAVTVRGDYAAGNRASRRILALSEARGYEPATSQARFLRAMLGCWFGPIEEVCQETQRAREGLISGGDLANAAYTYHPTVYYLLDWAPSLNTFAAEVQAGLAFVRRTGNHQAGEWLDFYRWLAAVLRGETSAAADDAIPADSYAGNPLALLHGHLTRAIAGAIFGDLAGLARHTAATMTLLPIIRGIYPAAVVRVLRGLALAGQARSSHGSDRRALLAELDEVTQWVAARAEDAPANFLHLLRLLEAERAWTLGNFQTAALAFDTACRDATQHQRPWHHALIAERSGRFFLAHGLDHAGYGLLAEARGEYAAWGAAAKGAQLDWAYPTLRGHEYTVAARSTGEPGNAPQRRSMLTTGTVDLLGILSASQALSSETSMERLHARVVEVLGAMTGATDVNLLRWNEDRRCWLQPASRGDLPAGGPGREHAVPMSVLRYVKRTGEPLVVVDATRDERFHRDPYFADLDCCSLLALPIQSRDALRAVLVMENRLLRHAFNADRLDAAKLIAGQLAVSLDNAQLYTELSASRARIVSTADHTRRRIERDLHDGAQQRLVSLALKARTAQARVPPEAGELAAQLNDLARGLNSALDELRELARGVHPAILAAGGLRPALKQLARRCSVPVRLDVRGVGRLPEPIEIAAYYVVSETLTNATKHADSTVVDIHMDVDDDLLRIRVHDDGRGGARLDGGTGLLGLRDRVETLGGRLRIHSPAGAGTTVEAELPYPTTTR